MWLLEAKGNPIGTKPTKKYFCELFLNNVLHARTCAKDRRDILFWGESFDFGGVTCQSVRVALYQETVLKKKQSKKDKENVSQLNGNRAGLLEIHGHMSNQTLLGYVNIPVSSIEGSQPVEKVGICFWYTDIFFLF